MAVGLLLLLVAGCAASTGQGHDFSGGFVGVSGGDAKPLP